MTESLISNHYVSVLCVLIEDDEIVKVAAIKAKTPPTRLPIFCY